MSKSTTFAAQLLSAKRSLYSKLKSGDVRVVLFLLVGTFTKLDTARLQVARAARRWLFAGTKDKGSLIGAARGQLLNDGVPVSEWTNDCLAGIISSMLIEEAEFAAAKDQAAGDVYPQADQDEDRRQVEAEDAAHDNGLALQSAIAATGWGGKQQVAVNRVGVRRPAATHDFDDAGECLSPESQVAREELLHAGLN